MSRLRLSVTVTVIAILAVGVFLVEALRGDGLAWLPFVLALSAGGVAAVDVQRVFRDRDDTIRSALVSLAGADYDQRLSPVVPGPIGRAYDHAAESVARRQRDLRAATEELQKRIDERTVALRSAEEQILRTRRLTALGSLGAGIAHELGNPMTAIVAITGLLEQRLSGDPQLAESVTMLAAEARRVVRVMDDFKQFVEREKGDAGEAVSLLRTVKDAIELYRGPLEDKPISVCLRFATRLPPVQGQRERLQALVASLLQNAVDAMSTGGTLCIALEPLDRHAVKLVVADTGRGIPRDIQDRIFDPFFSTKQSKEHPGMGLAIAHSVVAAHHGSINVDSSEGKGSAFTVVLPAAPDAAHLY